MPEPHATDEGVLSTPGREAVIGLGPLRSSQGWSKANVARTKRPIATSRNSTPPPACSITRHPTACPTEGPYRPPLCLVRLPEYKIGPRQDTSTRHSVRPVDNSSRNNLPPVWSLVCLVKSPRMSCQC